MPILALAVTGLLFGLPGKAPGIKKFWKQAQIVQWYRNANFGRKYCARVLWVWRTNHETKPRLVILVRNKGGLVNDAPDQMQVHQIGTGFCVF